LVKGGMRFDLILCDLTARDEAALAFYDAVLRHDPRLAREMVFLTGGTMAPNVVSFLSALPNRRIAKPCDTQELRKLVNDSLGRRTQ
jgi:DNA-binding NarL/FixJ family response regulator